MQDGNLGVGGIDNLALWGPSTISRLRTNKNHTHGLMQPTITTLLYTCTNLRSKRVQYSSTVIVVLLICMIKTDGTVFPITANHAN